LARTHKRHPVFALGADPVALVCIGFLLVLVFAAIFAPVLTPFDPTKQNLAQMLMPPGADGHRLGTDDLGRDLFARILYGARYSLAIGGISVLVGTAIGVVLGLMSGYFRGAVDVVISHVVDTMFAFPGMLLAVMLAAYLGAGLINVIVAVAFWSIPTFARLSRAAVLEASAEDYVLAATALGAPPFVILGRHVLRNIWGPVGVYATQRVASAIVLGASLSFLGLGVQPPTPEWGALVSTGRDYLTEAPYLVIVPSAAIALTVLAMNIVGDWLRDVLDPHLRQTR
jgi:peptide/nickel transport system permease protein